MIPRVVPPDPRTVADQRTELLEAVDRALAEAGAPGAPSPARRCLAVAQGGTQRLVPLREPITTIGRGFAAAVQLEDPGVSRRHAIVVQRRGGVRILDDRSANGTWVNGQRVFEADLHDGDVIVIGRVVLVYVDMPA